MGIGARRVEPQSLSLHPKIWQFPQMTPTPYLQLLPTAESQITPDPVPSAAFALLSDPAAIEAWQRQADTQGLALILPSALSHEAGRDGFWFHDAASLKRARKDQPQAQLVGLVTDRHEAMVMGEAGADLIVFGGLDPLIIAGDYDMACWWAEMFEVPCACLVLDHPSQGFGGEGQPEFFLI